MDSGISWGRQNIIVKSILKNVKERMKEKRILRLIGILLITIFMLIVSVSAFIIETSPNIITLTFNQGILGDVSEGQTMHYTAGNASSLDDIIRKDHTNQC